EIIQNTNYRFGGVDKDNPRVEAVIHNIELKKEEKIMQIILNQNEIEEAIRKSIIEKIYIKSENVEITLKASRGEEGFTATIEIGHSELNKPAGTHSYE